MKSSLPFLIAGALLLSGCATYRVQVEATREQPAAPATRAYFLDLEKLATSRGPQFGPAVRCLRAALAHRGCVEVDRREAASVVVLFGYTVTLAGIEIGHSTRSTEFTRMPAAPISTSRQRVDPPPPTREVFVVQERQARYRIAMRIEARDASTDDAIWRVESTALIGPNDRNAILPCLIAAAETVLEPAADTVIEVAVGQRSPAVRALRGGS